jgi:hypothetical protein
MPEIRCGKAVVYIKVVSEKGKMTRTVCYRLAHKASSGKANMDERRWLAVKAQA